MQEPAPPPVSGVLKAPPHWRSVDLISDLHLHPDDPDTLAVLETYLDGPLARQSDALIVLGDLFEVWVGDDALAADLSTAHLTDSDAGAFRFWRGCARLLHGHAQHRPVWFMAGNRDFLLGQPGLQACGMQPLQDPTRLEMLGHRWLLSHGDALCLDDTDYMAFRKQVRDPRWQREFLDQPLRERAIVARQLRQRSQERQRQLGGSDAWFDVDTRAAISWLGHTGCTVLIHGHTHRPGHHELAPGLERVVLSDWDARAKPPRAEVLRLDEQGWRRLPLLPAI